MKTKHYIAGFIFFCLLALGIIWIYNQKEENVSAGVSGPAAENIIGTRIGTSTSVVTFYGSYATNGTTSKSTYINGGIDTITYTIKPGSASTTNDAKIYWNIVGSNDSGCNNATTSAMLLPRAYEINWYSITDTYARATGVYIPSVTNATGTKFSNATGTSVTLTDVNWECLRFEIAGSSTEALIQLKTKQR